MTFSGLMNPDSNPKTDRPLPPSLAFRSSVPYLALKFAFLRISLRYIIPSRVLLGITLESVDSQSWIHRMAWDMATNP